VLCVSGQSDSWFDAYCCASRNLHPVLSSGVLLHLELVKYTLQMNLPVPFTLVFSELGVQMNTARKKIVGLLNYTLFQFAF